MAKNIKQDETEPNEPVKPDSLDNGLYLWVKKDGTELQLNDAPATIAAAKKLGWKQSK